MKMRVLWAVSPLSVIITCAAMPLLPDTVPMHYGLDGTVDRYGSKYENFIFSIVILVFSLFWTVLIGVFQRKVRTSEDGKAKARALSNIKVLETSSIASTAVLTVLQCIILLPSVVGAKLSVASLLPVSQVALGLLMVILGNIMPRTRLNSVIGLRTPWSMKNDALWARSNRFGGATMVVAGILIALSAALIPQPASMMAALAILIMDGLVSAVYSFLIYRRSKEDKNMEK